MEWKRIWAMLACGLVAAGCSKPEESGAIAERQSAKSGESARMESGPLVEPGTNVPERLVSGTNAEVALEPPKARPVERNASTNAVRSVKASPVDAVVPGEDVYERGLALLEDVESGAQAKEATRLLREAAELGNASAQQALGACYLNGIGVEQDAAEGAKWLEKSAEQGHAEAQFKLASLHARGEGVPQNFERAAELAKQAAEQGHVEAQYNLATMYSAGRGVPNDMGEATKWFRAAAEAGHGTSQSNLGVLYAAGKVVEKDMAEAVKWFRRAAEQGQPTAQFNLAQAYHDGKAVEKDFLEAYKWYTLAAQQGDRDAQILATMVAVDLTPTELGEAVKRAGAFRPKAEKWEPVSR